MCGNVLLLDQLLRIVKNLVFKVKNMVLRSTFLNLWVFRSIFLDLMFKNVRILVFRGQKLGFKVKMFEFIVFQVDFLRFNVLKRTEFWFFEAKNLVFRSKCLNLWFFRSIFLDLMF